MFRIMALLGLSLIFVTANALAGPVAPTQLAALRTELLQMLQADQAVRKTDIDSNNSAQVEALWRVDAQNQARLKEIMQMIGWPTAQLVGEDASRAAFMIAQHAAFDLPFMEVAFKHIEAGFFAKEVSGHDFALMADRIQMLQGKPQKYGTQFLKDKKACAPWKILEPEKVDEYRAQIGLPLFADYVQRVCNHSPN